MADKKKKVFATSPSGAISWFKLIKPDQKYKKYTVDLIVEDTPELQKIIAKVEELKKEALAELIEKTEAKNKHKAKMSDNAPIEPQRDANGKPTGKYVMKFRLSSEGVNKDKEVYHVAPPALFDAKALPIGKEAQKTLMVYNGSIAKISFEMSQYGNTSIGAGVTFRPKACQLLKIQQADADASQFGFAASEFEQDTGAESEFQDEASEASGGVTTSNEDF